MLNSKMYPSSTSLLTQTATNVRKRIHAKRNERHGQDNGRCQPKDEESKLRLNHEKVHVRERTHECDELVRSGRHGRRLGRYLR